MMQGSLKIMSDSIS